MARRKPRAGGGTAAVRYTIEKGVEAGGVVAMARRLSRKNACKTCAVGMGGQQGGMRNEGGSFPEVCKKSVQAQAADMQPPIGDEFFRRHAVADLERLSGRELEAAGRLGFPVLWREGDEFMRRVSWAEALAIATEAMRACEPSRAFFYASGRSSNEAGFLLQCFARAWGTNNVNNCSFYCHQASSVALQASLGTGTATVRLDDLERADLAVVIGANPASNHPRLITQLVDLRRRGGRVIVVNPLRELGLVRFRVPSRVRSMLFGSDVSDLYLQPHVGGDVALLKLLLLEVLARGGVDAGFVASSVDGWDDVVADLRTTSREALLAECGVPEELVRAAADAIVASRATIWAWAMGITQHAHGVDNVQAITNLALARGMVGRPGAGLLPIRGHSNVQGIGSVGVSPTIKAEFARRLGELYGIAVPSAPGLHTLASVEAASRGEIDLALLLGGNLFGASPDRNWTGKALRQIGTAIHVTTKLNEGHVHGRGRTNLLLPAVARDEETQSTTQESMFSFVRLSEGGSLAASPEMRPETAIITALAAAVLPPGPVDFASLADHRALRAAIAAVVPGYAEIGEIDRTHEEFDFAGRVLREPRFATPSGRAVAAPTPVPVVE
ncbi:MAG: molybdopterin-dependent oxidoreductase, partial [Alphaproteobacteria bacterium]